MEPILIIRPEIALDDFYLYFIFIFCFAIWTVLCSYLYASKMERLKNIYAFCICFWALQTYCMYFVADKIQSNDFTVKSINGNNGVLFDPSTLILLLEC